MLIHMISNCSFGLHFYSVLKPTQILSQICYQFSIWISLRYLSLFHYLFVCSSSSLPWSTSSHISESRRIASRRLLVYWKQKLCETTINKTTQICDAAWFHLGGWKDIETYCFTFNRKKSTWHDGKVHFKGKKNTNFKQRIRLSSDPQQKKLHSRGSRGHIYASLWKGMLPYWAKWKTWLQYWDFIRFHDTFLECQHYKHIITCTTHDSSMLQWEYVKKHCFLLSDLRCISTLPGAHVRQHKGI